jgi:hypothetical protein
MTSNKAVDSVLFPLSESPLQAYLTNTLQVADVVEWAMAQMDGQVSLRQTSFSISEEFIRRLWHLQKSGKVSQVELILDHKATNKTLRLWPFLVQTINRLYLADNHSKLILLESDTAGTVTQVAIITSQNLTRGNRHESAIITTDPGVFRKLMEAFTEIRDRHSVPLKELYNIKMQ